jgi:hypothetical protein
MGAGTLALACLWLVGQVSSDVVYTNQLNHRIDVQFKIQRSEIKELRLFCSPNQGRDWDLAAVIGPDKDYFVFRAPGDGTYWLRVASVNHKGEQFPENPRVGPPNQKMVIDTAKPIIRTLQARRQGGEVLVAWEVQEDNPDVPSFRLEYQPKDSHAGLWTAIAATAAPTGEVRFPSTGNAPLQVRLSLRDLAGNQSFAIIDVAGDSVTTAAYNPTSHPGGVTQLSGSTTPGHPLDLSAQIPIQPPPSGGTLSPIGPPPINPGPIDPAPPLVNPGKAVSPPAATPGASPPAGGPRDEDKVIASSRWLPAAGPTAPPAPAAPVPEAKAVPPAGPTRQLPAVQYINQPEFLVAYEVSKLGPSGIGSVELYRTRDDGQTWEKYAYDATVGVVAKGVRLQRMVQFHDGEPDGIYGFVLVIKNRANIGRRPPQPGDAPEIRIELDTTRPEADLFTPVRDAQPGCLLLTWRAADKNATPSPINLEWSEQRGGPWHPIGTDLPNTGRYSWKLPDEMPVNVYLRLRARDLAGNETAVITPNPLPVDLHEPEGHLIDVSLPVRHP